MVPQNLSAHPARAIWQLQLAVRALSQALAGHAPTLAALATLGQGRIRQAMLLNLWPPERPL